MVKKIYKCEWNEKKELQSSYSGIPPDWSE